MVAGRCLHTNGGASSRNGRKRTCSTWLHCVFSTGPNPTRGASRIGRGPLPPSYIFSSNANSSHFPSPPDGDGDARSVVLNLIKKKRTTKNGHWRTVIQGDAEINTAKFGPTVHAVDPSDRESMRAMVRAMREDKEE